ncbi:MAG: YXWGXW repeat-containing protein, partial [Rubrivivax sp.]
ETAMTSGRRPSEPLPHLPPTQAPFPAAAWPPRRRAFGLAVLGAVALTGCVIAPLPPAGPWRSDEGPVVDAPPPPPRYEAVPVAPGVAYVWIGGHWAWQAGRHVWIGGRWALPPAGHAWVPGYWGRHGPGWRWHGGYWRRR